MIGYVRTWAGIFLDSTWITLLRFTGFEGATEDVEGRPWESVYYKHA